MKRMLRNSARSLSRQLQSSRTAVGSVRHLDLHEHYSKELAAEYGCRVQRGIVATTAEEAFEAATKLRADGARDLIVKSQVLAGGRGKGYFNTGFKGGVKICDSPEQVKEMSAQMLNNTLYTKQCTEAMGGQPVRKVLVHEGVDFTNEYYFSILLDRAFDGPAMIGSPCGGMDIEEVAESTPEKLLTIPIDWKEGLTDAKARQMAEFLGFKEERHIVDAMDNMKGLYNLFKDNDCTQIEINPIVQTTEENYGGKVYLVDAKLNFDDSTAGIRNDRIFNWRDPEQEDAREVEAAKWGLNYVGLDGEIGCLVNGAGLAMATMDIIKLYNGEPANFLDVGGGANEEQVTEAFKLITKDPKVKGIFVNIFGGIMKCDTIANGVVAAAKTLDLEARGIPLVVRLSGTNVEEGKQILADSGLLIQAADDMDEGAQAIVKAIKK